MKELSYHDSLKSMVIVATGTFYFRCMLIIDRQRRALLPAMGFGHHSLLQSTQASTIIERICSEREFSLQPFSI